MGGSLRTIFERLVQESPVAVMVRATLENAFAPEDLDGLFAQTAQQQDAHCCFPLWSSW
jgi:hypothetical protein